MFYLSDLYLITLSDKPNSGASAFSWGFFSSVIYHFSLIIFFKFTFFNIISDIITIKFSHEQIKELHKFIRLHNV
ncbi:hypothetical protein SOPP22_01815 [Shewanella sp. OPT22]|nr:hypothetical protein SOPP22_01815 [Shewanella sp. OPT22]